MTTPEQFDAVVIGSGQGGDPLARALAKAGRQTALIEREHIGGTCVNEGCTPTKTMVASARVAYLARRSGGYGVESGDVRVNMSTVRGRKRAIVDSFRGGDERRVEATDGLEWIRGVARFSGPKSLDVTLTDGSHRALTSGTIVIDTGTRPAMPPVEGLAATDPLNSTTIMELDELPERLVVLGGGYVGLEFGQMFRRFGSDVTIIQRGPQLLGREDADVAGWVAGLLREDGIEVLLEADATKVERNARGEYHVTVSVAGGERIISGTHLLAAAGRTPNTEDLNLAGAGIETMGGGFITVNERLETNVQGVYAIGDVNGGPAFTHISFDDFRILRTNLIDRGNATTRDRLVPYTVFIDPQLGRIGLGEQEAREQGREIRVAQMPMNSVARALEVDESRGMMKVVVDAETDQVLGCAILGIEGGELMAMLEIAMIGKVTASTLRETIFAHPTLAESFNNLFAHYKSDK